MKKLKYKELTRMSLEEKNTLLHMLKEQITFTPISHEWHIEIQATDFDLRHECDNLEEYKKSMNYYIYKLLNDEEI